MSYQPHSAYGFSFARDASPQHHEVKAPQQYAIQLSDKLHPRIKQLGLESWQQQVYGLILARSYKEPLMECVHCGRRGQEAEQVALKLLEALERLERSALVKLAVWKGQCLANPNVELKSYFDYSQWSRKGWKELKEAFKDHSAMGTVVACLAPFLEDEEVKDEEVKDEEEEEDSEDDDEYGEYDEDDDHGRIRLVRHQLDTF